MPRPRPRHRRKPGFMERHLDPASRLGEILFGLIMVLTTTLTAGLTVSEGRAGVRQLLLSALGCNLAWGIIDGAMYLMNLTAERSGQARLARQVKEASDPEAGLGLVREALEPELEVLATATERESFFRAVHSHLARSPVPGTRLTSSDWMGAIACFCLVFISCLPAAVPFMVFHDPLRALRISNGLLILMLFVVGWKWAQYAGTRPWWGGLSLVTLGLALVGVAILLGG